MYRTIDGKYVNDDQVKEIQWKNQELWKKAQTDISALLDIEFLFSEKLYEAISAKEENPC